MVSWTMATGLFLSIFVFQNHCCSNKIFSYKQCSKLCGEGIQSRQVKCYRKVDGVIEILSDDECDGEKPEDEQKCLVRPCEGIDWITSSWSGVS